MPAELIYVILSRIATAYYFIHFLLILPLLPKFEPTKPLPVSIGSPIFESTSPMATMAKAVRQKQE